MASVEASAFIYVTEWEVERDFLTGKAFHNEQAIYKGMSAVV
jgi:hypothetical protein